MKRRLNEGAVKRIYETLLERFGSPLIEAYSDGQGVPSDSHTKNMGNRGFGADLCQNCGSMMGLDEEMCGACMDESEAGGKHPGHAASCTCPDCRIKHPEGLLHDEEANQHAEPPIGEPLGDANALDEEDLDQVAPKGWEGTVKAMKKHKGIKNPWALAWSMKNKGYKSHKKEGLVRETREMVRAHEVLTTWEDLYIDSLRNKRKGDPQNVSPGTVTFDDLVSWLGTTEDAVRKVLPATGLVVDQHGNVVERGQTPKPFPAAR